VGLSLGPSDLVWIPVKPERLGDRKIPRVVGGYIWWHPCLFWPSDLMGIMLNPIISCLLF